MEFNGGPFDNPDCPEHSLHGIRDAIRDGALPNSVVTVLTDDDANDPELEGEILSIVEEKQLNINFILTYGKCTRQLDYGNPGFRVYKNIAEHSNGQYFSIDKEHVGDIFTILYEKMHRNYVNIIRKEFNKKTVDEMDFDVDSTMTN
jgi:hypothetical protein